MELPPPHVLAQLDALIVGQSIAAPSVEVEDDDDRSISSVVPRARKAYGHVRDALRKRRREEPAAATPSTRARRPRRAVSFDEFQPDDEDGWD